MTKPTTPSVLRHIIFWTLWFGYEFLGHYSNLAQYTPMQWAQTLYNCLSLPLAIYIAYGCALKFFRSAPAFIEFWAFSLADKYRLLGNKYLLGIGCTILTYMSLSIWLDNEFFGWAGTEMVFQFKSRFTKLRDLLAITVLYSALKVYVTQSKQQLFIANYQIKIRDEVIGFMKSLFTKIKTNIG